MAEESAQEKTEDPTPKRLEKALEDGQVLTSKELFVFSTLFTGFLMYFLILTFSDRILGEFKGFFSFDLSDFPGELLRMSSGAVSFILVYGVLFALPIFFVVLFTQGVLSGGINVSVKAMSFKGSRINPLEGLKRMFSTKALVELAKAVLKVSLLLGTAALVISLYMPQLTTSSNANLLNGLSRAGDVFIALMVTLLIGLVVIAFLDVLWQRYQHIEKLKMSLQDVKDENKQTEGSPEVKAKIRRMQMQTAARGAEQRAALANVAEATAVITNPTHFAVALKYEVGTSGAPTILAMGRGKMAADIIEIATKESITIFQSPLLARALYFTGNIGQEIHEELFSAVAAVLAFIFRVAKGEELDAPDISIPDDLQFNETGAPLNG